MNKHHYPNTVICCRQVLLVLAGLLFWAYSSAQCTLACNNGVQISLNNTGMTTVTPDALLENMPIDCANNLVVQIQDSDNVSLGNTVSCNYLNAILTATVLDTISLNMCQTNIILEDYLPPTLNCPDLFIYCHQSVHPDSIGYSIFADNCTQLTIQDLTYNDEWVDLDCATTIDNQIVTRKLERFWSISDGNGLTTTCTQHIYLKNILFSDIDFPANKLGVDNPELDCSDDPNNLVLTGKPSALGQVFDDMDYCDLNVFYNDQFFPTCGGGQQLHRTWEVHNWCTDNFVQHLQVINFADNTAPEMTCISDITINTDAFDCTATVHLPQPSASDNCSTSEIIPTWEFGIGFVPYNNVPAGTYTVTYTAYDVCGNTSDCTTELTIEDQEVPVAICKDLLSVGLQADGSARIYANTFDNGSTDNCEIAYLEVSRTNSGYGNYVEFDCSDVGNSPIEVHLRVHDTRGFFNICTGRIDIMDNVFPQINCPSDITIQCTQDYTDLSQTGRATATDNCDVDTLYFEDIEIFNSDCGTATIYRQWMVRDIGNLEKSCTQVITIENNHVLEVSFPDDIIVDFCQGNTLPSSTGEPQIFNDICRNVATTYEDQLFSGLNTCSSILRHWMVVDWCAYDASSGSETGRYQHSQWLQIEDTQAPVIQCLTETVLTVSEPTCVDTYVQIPLINVIECDSSVIVENDSPFATKKGADASGIYPFGTHTIHYTATDFCGNVGTCAFTLILECAAPEAMVAGTMMTETGLPVADVQVQLLGDANAEKPTSILGDFAFESLAIGQSYQVLPQKDENDGDGVSTFDIVLISQHILGLSELDSPYKMIAADVNNSGTISTFDIVQIRQLVLYQITSFPNSNSWRFVAADHEFSNPRNPFSDPFPEAIDFPNLEEDALHAHFVAIKMGDVNGSWE